MSGAFQMNIGGREKTYTNWSRSIVSLCGVASQHYHIKLLVLELFFFTRHETSFTEKICWNSTNIFTNIINAIEASKFEPARK